MKALGGVLGAATFLLLLATVGSAEFPGKGPHWAILLGLAGFCAVLSVLTFSQSKT
jgi:hypothetical protein